MVECVICGTVIRLSVQATEIDSHYVNFCCPKCNQFIKVKYGVQNTNVVPKNIEDLQNIGKCIFSYENAIEVNKEPEYSIRSSAEFLTEPLIKYEGIDKLDRTPFFLAWDMKISFGHFRQNMDFFLYRKSNYLIYNNAVQLYLNDNYDYFPNNVSKILPLSMYPSDSELERLRAVHAIKRALFRPLEYRNIDLTDKLFNRTTSNPGAFAEFIDYLILNDKLITLNKKIYRTLMKFLEKIDLFFPIYSLDFTEKQYLPKKFMITTFTLEDIKGLYIDGYETFIDTIGFASLFSNLYERGSYKNFPENMNLDKYKKMSKLSRLRNVCKEDLIFSEMPFNIDNIVRNSFGHNDYIEIYGSNILKVRKNDKSNYYEVSLMEVATDLFDIYKNLILYEEFVYKVYQNLIGYKLQKMQIRDFDVSKIGRNEKCFCGSLKKYKKCCG